MATTNNLICSNSSIISTHLKRPVTKNIENTINHIVTSRLNYRSPSDRLLGFSVEGAVTSKEMVTIRTEITPYYVDISNPNNSQSLHKSIVFETTVPLESLTEELTKEFQWVINYFGFTIMYIQKKFKKIRIEKVGKGYTLEYLT